MKRSRQNRLDLLNLKFEQVLRLVTQPQNISESSIFHYHRADAIAHMLTSIRTFLKDLIYLTP